ncbi:wax ester/triacylglycerol synthase family O-acyltransferase [Spongiibacter sp. KMU-158]|uniref:diacylglycerol O-acyltransferase n=1 Tax=Spongiibacter pelagi TaxID=2760804 RepID=A0A927C1X9_9GAMM|nr:wax ester/triacylglycerol synthase family O-acyltransferase [Spongiibacter pelagi]MBD2859784.1 wax ester/triacylglycerol synthase family O-acyltransferase [Spongiibacter pelagi]
MSKLSIMDLAFFLTESDASPKHIGGLMMFRKPAKAPANFVQQAVEQYVGTADDVGAPFNQVINFTNLTGPCWETAINFDVKEHIHYHTLEGDDFRDSLYELVGDLHGPILSRDKPMWEMHVIEGIDDQRFALYTKLHHAYADGVTMSSILAQSLSKSATEKTTSTMWAALPKKRQENAADSVSIMKALTKRGGRYTDYIRTLAGLSKLTAQLALESVHLTKNAVAVPFKGRPKTPLTGRVIEGRQFASASVPMDKVNHLRQLTRSTLNHIALTCIDGALHRYLQDCDADIDQPIAVQMPVNLRRKGDNSMGNKIGIVLVELAKRTEDPYERLREIGFTLRNVRYQIDGVPATSVMAYTVLLGSFAQLAEMLRLENRVPPLGNTLISNVPGPNDQLYLKGAALEEMYPISALTPGNHLNITIYSYNGRLQFGLVATSALPRMERLGDYIHEAFEDLEKAVTTPRP